MQQKTIKHTISCFGIGVHSGKPTSISLYPAPENTGVVFIRTDVKNKNNKISAKYTNVSKTTLGTTIQNQDGIEIATIEHLMAALWGCGIDNVFVELDGAEIPIMDGSSEPFIFMIECAGTKDLDAPRKYIEVLKEIHVEDKNSFATISPSNHFSVDMEIKFDNKTIDSQTYHFSEENKSFKHNIARARTFGFEHEGALLKKMGLAKGASLENAIVLRGETILNDTGLRYKDEFVRHKLLDLIGDVYLAGSPLKCHIKTFKPGHTINNKILHAIFSDPSAWRVACD